MGGLWYYRTLPNICQQDACNLTAVAQRDYYKYFGVSGVDNSILYNSAEQPNSFTSECGLFYDSMRLLPSGNLPYIGSRIIQAARGAGKTQIRQCILSRLPRENHILIKIYGMNINNYLDNFVTNTDMTSEPGSDKIRKYWTTEHFLQVILTEIASRFIDEKYFPIIKQNQNQIPLQTRLDVAVLLGFYSPKDHNSLCKVVDLLVPETRAHSFFGGYRELCNGNWWSTQNENMLKSLENKHRKIKVKRETVATDYSLKILATMFDKIKYLPEPLLELSYRDQLGVLINFLSALKISTTVVVDSLDENKFFFNKEDPTLSTLQTFINSVANDDVLQLGLGNWGAGSAMSNICTFHIFVPQKSNVTLNILWSRPDKIPIINLTWNELQLINYADYILDYLRTKSSCGCKSLPDICSLLGGKELCHESMKRLRHPRDFNIFFKALIGRTDTVCTERNPPFHATKEDIDFVFTNIQTELLKEDELK
ncbi:unnamed protein product [Adineta steineri]|uniref:Uncharacterized protein n=1 Tax=Adineta steineri TaxID=433720 RepID=A0A815R8K7_9BILA|nr:unnamed protein product [Adineta steineri]CAF1473660.1 unnamed protein product [Adineta steineri]CAF4120329.1 unnamed protein product [Adineta steineri]CAF4161051.1 unnamed protein product [Adineta steineri]